MAISTTPDRIIAPTGGAVDQSKKPLHVPWRALVPVAVTCVLALLPHPTGLAPHAWYFFAIFAGVIVALMLEPLPGGAIGLIGVTVVAVLSPFVLFSPEELAKPGFKAFNSAVTWELSGFANATVWLIFAAFMFALGYDKTGLGRRIASAMPSPSRTRFSRRSRRRTPRARAARSIRSSATCLRSTTASRTTRRRAASAPT